MDEYNNNNVGASPCSYKRLRTYNVPSPGTTPPIPATETVGYQIVPAGSSVLSYNTLIKDPNGCGAYPGIMKAYGASAGSCDPKYTKRSCK